MRWNVEGADVMTGKDRLVTIEAESPRQAEEVARGKGMLVAAVHPVKVLSAADKLDQMMGGKLDASTVTTTTLIEQMTAAAVNTTANVVEAGDGPPSLEHRSAPAATGRSSPVRFASDRPVAPDYRGLRFAAMVLAVFAALSYLAGVLSLGIAILAFVANFYMRQSAAAWLSVIVGMLTAMAPLAVGAMLHAMSSACIALRDIARNSFAR